MLPRVIAALRARQLRRRARLRPRGEIGSVEHIAWANEEDLRAFGRPASPWRQS